MGKIAWLIVSDLHLYYKKLASRIDYVHEMRAVREMIEKIAIDYKSKGFDKVNMLLLGDVFHRSYQDTFIVGYDIIFFVMWKFYLGDIFSIIGNHELHFYASNPFFTLVNEIESEKVKSIVTDVWTPQGLLPIIQIVDKIEDGEVTFHFNHFGTSINKPDANKINIGLFHQDVVSREIVQEAEQSLQTRIFANTIDLDNLPELAGYHYCFFGHMHQIYGIYKGDSTTLFYLASLGRTNVREIDDRFCERCVPAVLTENGKFIAVEENPLMLPNREESVREVQATAKHNTYELEKKRKEARTYMALSDDPAEGLLNYFADDPVTTKIIKELLRGDIDETGGTINRVFSKLVGG